MTDTERKLLMGLRACADVALVEGSLRELAEERAEKAEEAARKGGGEAGPGALHVLCVELAEGGEE